MRMYKTSPVCHFGSRHTGSQTSKLKAYEKTRDFLDFLGDFCEKVNRFPDISFGKTYANITIRPSEDNEKEEISKLDYDFATQIDLLIK